MNGIVWISRSLNLYLCPLHSTSLIKADNNRLYAIKKGVRVLMHIYAMVEPNFFFGYNMNFLKVISCCHPLKKSSITGEKSKKPIRISPFIINAKPTRFSVLSVTAPMKEILQRDG